ncbi:MAG: hypothetical protein CL623_09200 [Arcobacter sp.]|nr:hypothetical protein [Arcobacter sp.]|tara:strand:- start:11666 stop:12250 length:585 start_codon:yes stop_codon:yes gene_type:complete
MKKLFLSMFLFFIPLFSSSTTKTYTVAFLKDWKPYYIIEDDNKLNGYTYELFKEISKKVNLKFEYKVINTWKEVFELAKNGEIDIVPNVGITKNRELLFNFTQPTDTFKIRLFKKHNTFSISNMEDLKTNKVGVISANACNKLITNEISSKKIVFSDLAIALSSLIKGDIDILCYPQSHMNEKLNELKSKEVWE